MTSFQSLFATPGDPYMPYPENAPTADDLMSLGSAEIAGLPVELLANVVTNINERD